MKILFLGYQDAPLIDFLIENGEDVTVTNDKINPNFIISNAFEFIISYGYRYIIKKEVLDLLPGKVINLHISYLPWNKGADPNFWSIIDNTPKGVTIHLIDPGLDTGSILLQELVEITEEDTLRSSYQKLQNCIQDLFRINWERLKKMEIPPIKQQEKGSYHRSKDKQKYLKGIEGEWLDMTISQIIKHVKNVKSDT